MNQLKRNYRLRTSDFDRYGRLLPSSVLDIFQDLAGEHADYIGIGHDKMAEKNLFWILLKVRYEVLRYPELYTNICGTTWPHEPGKIDFIRDYTITDEKGGLLVRGTSQWAVVDCTTRRLTVPREVHFEIDEFCPEMTFGNRFSKVRDFEITETMLPYVFTSGYTDIDLNNHVNNIKYANYIMNAVDLPDDKSIREFQIDYRKEIHENESIRIYKKPLDEKTICVKGTDGAGDVRFAAEIILN